MKSRNSGDDINPMRSIFAIIWCLILPFISLAADHAAPSGNLSFTENKNQWEDRVQFKAGFNGGNMFLEKDAFTYVFHDLEKAKHLHPKTKEGGNQKIRMHAIRASFVGANPGVSFEALDPVAGYHNYFIGNDPSKWASRVRSYRKVIYHDLYPNIDLVIYSYHDGFKYDLIVHPGADPSGIRIQYEGHDELLLAHGNLKVQTSVGEFIEEKPYAYQHTGNESRQSIGCSFRLEGNLLTFVLDNYDAGKKLVIDPTLIFSTFSGSSADNWGSTATYDDDGNAYAGGIAFATGYPTTLGAFEENFQGGPVDVAITKYNPSGTLQRYATYLGGNNAEFPHSLIVNENDELLIFGTTGSGDFPLGPNAYDSTFGGGSAVNINSVNYSNGSDIFIAKLDSSGATLMASTYVGGTGNDGANYSNLLLHNYGDELRGEIKIDAQNNVYISSCTRSNNFPTPNGFQSNLQGTQDGVVFKMDAGLSTMIWSSYIGGSAFDAAFSLVLDDQDNVFVAGGTNSNDFPATAMFTNNQGGIDAFIAHIQANGSSIISATYHGTGQYDQAYFIDLDDEGDVFVLGQTQHNGNYFIKNVVYSDPSSWQFVTKFPPSLDSIILSTVFGSGQSKTDLVPSAFLVDVCNKIYISGWGGNVNGGASGGNTNNLPFTSDAADSVTDGSDYYIFVMDKDADALIYATYFGSATKDEHVDGGTSRFDKLGKIYQSVCSDCAGGSDPSITTAGAFAETHTSPNCNNLLFKFDLDFPILIADFDMNPGIGCAPLDVDFENHSSYVGTPVFNWDFGNGDTDTAGSLIYTYTQPGTYTVTLSVYDPLTCNVRDSITKQVIVLSDSSYSLPPDSFCIGGNTQIGITSIPDTNITYTWSPGATLSDSTVSNPIAFPAVTTDYTMLISSFGLCTDTVTQRVVVLLPPDPDLGPDTSICLGDSIFIGVVDAGHTYSWSPGATLSDSTISRPKASPATGTTYILTVDNGFCPGKDTIIVDVSNILIQADFTTDTTSGCAPLAVTFTNNSNTTPNTQFFWDFGDQTTSTDQNPLPHVYSQGGFFEVRLIISDSTSCNLADTAYANITVIADSTYALTDTFICKGDVIQIGIPPDPFLTYHWSPFIHLSDSDIANPIANPDTTRTYTLIISNGVCSDTLDQEIFVGPPLVFDLGPDSTICEDTPPIVIGILDEGFQYQWRPSAGLDNDTISSPLAAPSQTTTYILHVDNGFCEKEDTITIIINDFESEAGPPVTVCRGDSAMIGDPDQGWIYSWSPVGGLSNPNIAQPNASPDSTTAYILTVSDGYCPKLDTVEVMVIRQTKTTNPDVLICKDLGEQIGIPSSSGFTYDWSPAYGLSDPSASDPVATPDTTTTYTLLITNTQCTDTLVQLVEVGPDIGLNMDNTETTCKDLSVKIGVTDEGYIYRWSPATGLSDTTVSDPIASPDTTTRYILTVDNTYCVKKDTVIVEVNEVELDADFEAAIEISCEKTTISFDNKSVGATSFLWDFGDGNTTTETDPTLELERNKDYQIMLIADFKGECTDTAFLTYKDLEADIRKKFPNVFTPNDDGMNDCLSFTDIPVSSECFDLQIYNRWGERMFRTNDPLDCWEGKVQSTGEPASKGVYYYVLEIRDLTFTGYAELLR